MSEKLLQRRASAAVVAKYDIESILPLDEIATRIAFDQSVGLSNYAEITRGCDIDSVTCTLATANPSRIIDFTQEDYSINGKEQLYKGIIEIEYPIEDFDKTGGLPQLLSIIAGQCFSNIDIRKVRIIDLSLSEEMIDRFKGPKFGVDGIREKLGKKQERKPLIGVIMRPCLGLSPKEYARICKEIAVAGADFIKDDEKLVNPDYCPYEQRIPLVREALESVSKGRPLYIVNATCEACKLTENVARIAELGGDAVLLNSVWVGLSGIRSIAEDSSLQLPVYGHRVGFGSFARSKDFGIDTLVWLKLLRLAGVDMFSVGMIGGVLKARSIDVRRHVATATEDWYHMKPSLPICTAGMHPGLVDLNLSLYGTNDMAIFSGKGVHCHPDGLQEGIKAMKIAIEAHLNSISLDDAASKNACLRKALNVFGYPKSIEKKKPERLEP